MKQFFSRIFKDVGTLSNLAIEDLDASLAIYEAVPLLRYRNKRRIQVLYDGFKLSIG